MYRASYLLLITILSWLSCSTPPPYDQLERRDTDLFTAKEAPMLSEKVSKGELPPLNERLPEIPLIAKTNYDGYDRPGKYGGQWHRFHDHPELGTWKMTAGYAPFIRWKFDCSGLEPGTAESWEFN